jgi:hypothetical protein
MKFELAVQSDGMERSWSFRFSRLSHSQDYWVITITITITVITLCHAPLRPYSRAEVTVCNRQLPG